MASYNTKIRTTDGEPYLGRQHVIEESDIPHTTNESVVTRPQYASLMGTEKPYAPPRGEMTNSEGRIIIDPYGVVQASGDLQSLNNVQTLNLFQEAAVRQMRASVAAQNPEDAQTYLYPALGLAGETGEVAEKIKKRIRDFDGVVDDEARLQIALELGDVLFYLSVLAKRAGYTLAQVAQLNVDKIKSRNERGVVHGNGDNR